MARRAHSDGNIVVSYLIMHETEASHDHHMIARLTGDTQSDIQSITPLTTTRYS